MDFVLAKAKELHVDRVVLTGDQFHTHSIVHLEVLAFWQGVFAKFEAAEVEVVALVGNHDQSGDGISKSHSMMAFQNVFVVDQPTIIDEILHLPYMHSGEQLIADCKEFPKKVVVCHATFQGSTFENGFYAKEGIDQSQLPQEQIISGHIHAGQEFGKVWYVGSPRWMTISDANQDKNIWLVEHEPDGLIASRTAIPTDQACTRIVQFEDTAEAPASVTQLNPSWKYLVDVRGSAAFIEERKKVWLGKARVRTFCTDGASIKVKESDGMGVAFSKFLVAYQPKHGTPLPVLERMVADRIHA